MLNWLTGTSTGTSERGSEFFHLMKVAGFLGQWILPSHASGAIPWPIQWLGVSQLQIRYMELDCVLKDISRIYLILIILRSIKTLRIIIWGILCARRRRRVWRITSCYNTRSHFHILPLMHRRGDTEQNKRKDRLRKTKHEDCTLHYAVRDLCVVAFIFNKYYRAIDLAP